MTEQTLYLSVTLHTPATFGSGAGLAGAVDVEIEHDEYGCPRIGGRTLKGLLVEEWINMRPVLDPQWDEHAALLFGRGGKSTAQLHIGDATLPAELHAALLHDVDKKRLTHADVLSLFTSVRRQTAVDVEHDTPETGSLRSMRVLLPLSPLIAPLYFVVPPTDDQRALLAACVLAVRRGGLGRNRGRGRLMLRLHEEPAHCLASEDGTPSDDYTRTLFETFQRKVEA